MANSLGTTMVINTIMGTDKHTGADMVSAMVMGCFFRATTMAIHTGTAASTIMASVMTVIRASTGVTASTIGVRHGVGLATSSRLNHDVSAAESHKHPGLGPLGSERRGDDAFILSTSSVVFMHPRSGVPCKASCMLQTDYHYLDYVIRPRSECRHQNL